MSVTVQTIPQNPSTVLKDINGYFVPNILSFSLKKTSEDQPATETDDSVSRQNGEIITETDGGPKMSPKRNGGIRGKQQTSSFLLDPFFKPVAHNIESNKENPVLKALFGGNKHNLTPWSYVSKTPMTNCHPFKKTEFSHDLTSDDIPAKVPKSLMKKPSKVKKVFHSNSNGNNNNNNSNIISSNNNNNLNNSLNNNKCRNGSICNNNNNSNNYTVNNMRRGSSPENRTNNTKAYQLTRAHVSSTSTISLVDSNSRPDRKQPMSVDKVIDSGNNNKRKKITSQMSLPYACEKSRALQVNAERLIQLRTMVDDAIKSHKVYSMTGCYNSVRNALKQRGWVEKIDCDVKGRRKINRFEEIGQYEAAFQFIQKNQTVAAMKLSMQTNSGFAHNDQIHYTGQGEAEIINRMLKNVTEDLCWLSRPYPYYCYKDFDKFEMINRLPRAFFSNKIGLCNSLQQMQWFYETGVCSTKFPRTYNMSAKDEVDAFKEDYRLTSCINLLKWLVQAYRSGGEKAVRSLDGKIESNVIEFAMRRCAEFVKGKQHEDIDVADSPTVWDYQWDTFISQYYKVINDGYILRETKDKVSIKAIVSNVQSMLNIVKPYWPQFDIDGYQNFWIVKPGGRCCGAGIVIKNNLEQILGMVSPATMKETRFVVQKYIERPLLIYNTKFDIRQWFLVTNVYPLTIWMYRESYLRFCSQPFTLKSTHESIHLCNNAVQRRYKNGKRDRGLPDENMWDCYTFQTYLKAIGHPEAWDKYIYPGMKEGFIGALLASQDSMEKKRNCFELYGADFMLSDTLTDGPWLIEINSNPAMDSSTSVTARMCPQVLEDIIKVVIDRRDNKSAPTGAFEMVFRQNCPPVPPYLGMSLCVKGQKAYKHSGDNRSFGKKSKNKESSDSLPCTDTEEEPMGEKAVPNSNISTSDKTTKKETVLNSNNSTLKETRAKETVLDWNISILEETLKKGTNPLNQSDLGKKESVLVKTSLKGRKERSKKHKKVDWVRKNIEDLKSLNSTKPKSPRQHDSRTPSPKKLKANNTFRDELLKLLNALEVTTVLKKTKYFQKDVEVTGNKTEPQEVLVVGGLEIPLWKKSGGTLEDIYSDEGLSEEGKRTLMKLLQLCRQKANGEAIDWDTALKEFRKCPLTTKTVKSCPNLDAETEEKTGKLKLSESLESFMTARSTMSVNSSKSSLDLFRNWKTKLNETRQTCEALLTELQSFAVIHSKVKFREAIEKKIKDETEFIKRIRQYRKCRRFGRGKSRKGEGRDKMDDDGLKCWDGGGDAEFVPLAINSETGAVRNVNLPKMKQRSRPLLPSGSSGHGRKIDLSLEQACCH